MHWHIRTEYDSHKIFTQLFAITCEWVNADNLGYAHEIQIPHSLMMMNNLTHIQGLLPVFSVLALMACLQHEYKWWIRSESVFAFHSCYFIGRFEVQPNSESNFSNL